MNLQEQISAQQLEISRLKEVAGVATRLGEYAKVASVGTTRELKSLRAQLVELQVTGEERATIGRLHHQIISLELAETLAGSKFVLVREESLQLQAKLLTLERRLDQSTEALRQHRADSHGSLKILRGTLQATRLQYSGALTLEQQEK